MPFLPIGNTQTVIKFLIGRRRTCIALPNLFDYPITPVRFSLDYISILKAETTHQKIKMATPIEPAPDATVPPPPPVSTLPKAEDLLVTGLEQIKGYEAFGKFSGHMYAGLLPMDNGNRTGKIMFWLFEPTQQTFDNSMVMWLNGGPGCSSFNCGVLMEICTSCITTNPRHQSLVMILTHTLSLLTPFIDI